MGSSNSPRQCACHRNWGGSALLRTAPARPVEQQELLLHQDALGGDGSRASRSQEFGDRGQKMSEQDEQVSHGEEA